MIDTNDLRKVAKHIEMFLIAVDTIATALNQPNKNVGEDLMAISNWLTANKLVVDIDKTLKMTIGSSAQVFQNILIYFVFQSSVVTEHASF